MRYLMLDALRGLAALSVLGYHVHDIVLARTGTTLFGGVLASGHRGTDVFFVLSGFIMTMMHFSRGARVGRPGPFFLRRLVRLLPALWIQSLVAMLVYSAGFGGAEKVGKLETWHIVASFLLLPQQDPPLVNVSWTLVYEMAFYILFAIMLLNRRVGLVLLCAWQAAIIVVLAAGIDRSLVPGGFYLHPRCLGFGVGVLCAALVARQDGPAMRRAAPAILLAGVLMLCGDIARERYTGVDHWDPLFLLSLYLGSGMIMAGGTLLESAGRAWIPRPFLALGEVSYSVYLVHYSVVTLLVVTLLRFGVSIGWVEAVACGVGSLVVSVAFHVAIDAPLQAVLRRMLQSRLSRPHPGHAAAVANPSLPRA